MLYSHILPFLIWIFYTVLRATWRVTVIEPESFKKILSSGDPVILAHWHGNIPGVLHLLRKYRGAPMISQSKDGTLIANIAHIMGAKTARGSSHRGGVHALKGMLKLAKDGHRPVLAIDGPKGPRHKAKPGVFEISRIIHAHIAPLAAASSSSFVFKKAWDKTELPLPFAKIVVVWGEPLPPVARDQDSHDQGLALRLESSLANAEHQARNLIATP